MKRLHLLLILLLGVNLLPDVLAQQLTTAKRIRFEHLTEADGLPENSVTCMMQDHLGFMWLGTQNGLVRYDGTNMTVFQNSNSFTGRPIWTLYEDRNGDIWIGSTSLFRFERKTGRFIEYPQKSPDQVGKIDLIRFIHEDRQGQLWTIINRQGGGKLDRLNPKTGQWTYFRHSDTDAHSLASNFLYATSNPSFFQKFGFWADQSGTIWVVTRGETGSILHVFDFYTGRFKRIVPQANPDIIEAFKTIGLMASDADGNLFLSSFERGNGLFKYMPKTGQLQQYRHKLGDPTSLRCDSVSQLHVGRDGILWVSTQQGLDRLNPKTNRFEQAGDLPDKPVDYTMGKVAEPMTFGAELPSGDRWIISLKGLRFYHKASGHFIHYDHNVSQEDSLHVGAALISFFVDRTGLVWAGSLSNGLNKQSRVTKFPFVPLPTPQQNGWMNASIRSVYQSPDHPSVLWIGHEQGLSRYDRQTGLYTHYQYDSLDAHSISKGTVIAMTEDRKGRFWVATRPGGLNLMDWQNGHFTRFSPDPANANSLIDKRIIALLTASDGRIWVGTQGGLDRFDPDRQTFTHYYKADTSYIPALYARIEPLCTAGRRVAAILHPGDQVYKTVDFRLTQSTRLLVVAGGSWSSMGQYDHGWLEDSSGKRVWESDYTHSRGDGLAGRVQNQFTILSLTAGRYRLHYQSDGAYSYRHWTEGPPRHPDLWGIQLLRVTASEAGDIDRLARPWQYNGLSDEMIRSVWEDDQKNIWIGTNAGGLNRLNPITGEIRVFYDLLKGPISAQALLRDTRPGYFWVGDYVCGLLLMDTKGRVVKRYTTADGLPSNTVNSLYWDGQSHLWMGGTNGVARLDVKTGRIRRFGRGNGLSNLRMLRSAKTPDGTLYFCTYNGTLVIDPTSIEEDRQPPPVLLTDLLIQGKPATLGPDGQLPSHISVTKAVQLSHELNDLTFHFAALSYNRGAATTYAYRLAPIDNDWVQSGTIRQARYGDLSPGEYTFTVKAANADGYWNEQGTSIYLTIRPPWWQTWWAYGLYVLLFFGSLRAYIAYRSRALRRENHLLEKKVAERTNEVREQKEEIEVQRDQLELTLADLKTTQDQLIHKEKMASLGELTAGIAHEIQNPLNFVTNYSALSTKLLTQLTQQRQTTLGGESNDPSQSQVLATVVKNLQKIGNHGERASAIINGMLAHSRTGTSERRLTDLNALVKEYLRLAYHGQRVKAPSFNCQLVTEFDPNLDQVLIIPQQIGQVLLNLLTNAFYALQQQQAVALNSLTVWVSTKQVGELVEIRIRDNGAGIAEAVKDKIFQPFFTTKPPGEGTGLGLSLSYDIVTKGHGGTLTVASREGEGATFTVGIPTKKSIPPFIHPR